MDGRLNFKATLDDSDFKTKLAAMKRGVNSLNKSMGTDPFKKREEAFNKHLKTIKDSQKALQTATDPKKIEQYKKQIDDATKAMEKLVNTANKGVTTPKVTKPKEPVKSTPTEIINTPAETKGIETTTQKTKELSSSMTQVTRTTAVAKKGLDDFAKNMLGSTQLTKEQRLAFESYSRTVQSAKEGLKTATDPTQIALYNQRIKEATASMQRLVNVANKQKPIIAAPVQGRVLPYDSRGNSIAQMQDALAGFKDRLVGEKDINNIRQLNQNIQGLETNIRQATNVGKEGFDKMGNAIPEKKMHGFAQTFSRIAGYFGMFAAISAVLGTIRKAFVALVDFDRSMVNLSAIAGKSRKDLKGLEQEIRNVASTSLNTANAVADMATELIKLGTTPEGVKALLKPVNDLSIATGMAADQTAILIKGTLNAFQEGEGAATRYADVMARAMNLTALDASKFAESFKYIGATANVAGYTIEETAAMIGVLVDNNIQASTSGRILSSMFGTMAKQGKSFEEELERIRMSQDQLGLASKTFGREGARLGVILANNRDRLKELTTELENSKGSLAALTGAQLSSVSARFKIMTSAWTEFVLSIDSGNGVIATSLKYFADFGEIVAKAFTPTVRLSDALKNERLELNLLVNRISSLNEDNEERKKLLDELRANYPDFIQKIKNEDLANESLLKTLKDVNDAYRERIEVQMLVEKNEGYMNTIDGLTKTLIEIEEDVFRRAQKMNVELNLGLTLDPKNVYENEQLLLKYGSAWTKFVNTWMSDYKLYSNTESFRSLVSAEQGVTQMRLDALEKEGKELESTRIAREASIKSIKDYNKELEKALAEAKDLKGVAGVDFNENDLAGIKRFIQSKKLVFDTEEKTNDLTKQRLSLLDEIYKTERDLNNSVLTDREQALVKINDKYDDMITKAKELKANESAIADINRLRERETEMVTYRLETDGIREGLEAQRKDYEDFEEAKRRFGVEQAELMYKDLIDVSKSYYDVLNDEINKIQAGDEMTDLEKTRLDALFGLLADYSIKQQEQKRNDLEKLISDTITIEERLLSIQQEFAEKRITAEGITNERLRNERLKILEQQEKDATSVIENEIYERGAAERDMIRELTNYSRRQLKIRLQTTQEYLNQYSEFLSQDQKIALEQEAELLKSIIGATDAISRQNALLKEKEEITKAIRENTSKDPEIAKKLNKELEDVNQELDSNNKLIKDTAEGIQLAVQAANMLADAFGGANEELQRAMTTLSNLVNSIAQGNMAGAVLTVVDWLIQGVKDVFGTDREAERQRNQEIRRNQEEYNRMLREQLLLEIQLNDAYQSRVQAIKEEQEALLSNREIIINRMKEILNHFYEVYKEFGGYGSLFDQDGYLAWDALGLNEYFEDGIELSDELLNKLVQLNASAPLKGTLKELYDELIRLRDEFGSVDEAVRQLEKELKDRLTGTTAQALADSIRDGIASGKRSFADFADDIEGFLRNAILAGMSTKIIEPQIQELQDLLYEMMKDGVLTEEERREFEDRYSKIAEEAAAYLDLLNQAGVNLGDGLDFQSAKDGIKRITESQADRLTGILTGMQVDVIASREILSDNRNLLSSSLDNLIMIEVNTRSTADNTYQIVQILQDNQSKALGL